MELVALGPDVILAYSTDAVTSLLQVTRTVPIVFTVVADPVGAGFVDSEGEIERALALCMKKKKLSVTRFTFAAGVLL